MCPASGVDSSSTGACIFKLRVLRSLGNLADGWPTEPSRQSGRRVWPGSLGSALEPQAKVSRLLPGAPWPSLGARGFRCTAAGGDALLLGSSRRFSTTQLQVGLTPFSPAPRRRLHLCEPADRYWGLDPEQRPSARPPSPRSLLVSAGKGDVWPGLPCCPDPQAGAESLSRSSPLHTWNSSACLPDRAVSEAARLGLAAMGPRRLTPSHQGGVDFPETAGGWGGGRITTSAPQAANPCLSTICSLTLGLEPLRARCTFDPTTAGSVAELCPKPLMWLSLVVTPGLLFHVIQIFTFFCLSF